MPTPPASFDLVIVTDPRFPGGTATAVAAEVAASAAAGYRVGLVAVESSTLDRPFPFNPRLRSLIDEGSLVPVPRGTPVKASLALLHGPFCAGLRPHAPYPIEAERRLLVLHHPPFDANWRPYYAIEATLAHAGAMLGGPVELAPVGPAVRAQLTRLPGRAAALDWFNVVDAAPFARPPRRLDGRRPVIGRHSRPDPAKWPASAQDCLTVYPDDGRFTVRVLGGGPYLADLLGTAPGRWPDHWEVLPFGGVPAPDFLKGLDLFVYYHHPDWVEAFGLAVAEAMAASLPCVLPEAMAPLFGDAALCVPPEQAADAAEALYADPAAYRRRAEAGSTLVAGRFGPKAHVRRLDDLIGPPRAGTATIPDPRRVRLIATDAAGRARVGQLAPHLPHGVAAADPDVIVVAGERPAAADAGPSAWKVRCAPLDAPFAAGDAPFDAMIPLAGDPIEPARYLAELALIHRGERVSKPLYVPRNAG